MSRYVFTVNNYSDSEVASISQFGSDGSLVQYMVVGKEVGESGTPHLQGFLILTRTRRFTWVTSRLPRAHVEQARGSDDQAASYCKKDGNFVEFGVFPVRFQGRRSDLESALVWADEFTSSNGRAPTSPDVAVNQPSIYTRYPRFTRTVLFRAPPAVLQLGTPRPWQQSLIVELEGPADDRRILFYVDEDGGKGKTWLIRYMLTKYPHTTQALTIGKRDDLAYAIKSSTKVFLFNVPRLQIQYLRYEILEQLKDGIVFSPKYESQTKLFEHKVHVVVFSNEFPDHTTMSQDRFVLRDF